MRFEEFPLKDVGNTVGLVGGIWADEGHHYLLMFPEYADSQGIMKGVHANNDDWKSLLRQSDLVETEVLAKAEDGKIVKAIIRKCERNIDQQVSWNVFRRDGYQCRYCSRDDVPLTVDHLVLWEDLGPSTEANLTSACKKCNKRRGNMQYADWLNDPWYLKKAEMLTQEQRQANIDLLPTLDGIERVVRMKKRR